MADLSTGSVPFDVAVVGAGMAGLTAARSLADAGMRAVVIDKGRGVGGRLATRRMGAARVDHGAQFFTVRSEAFRDQVGRWMQGGVVREWCRGFRQPADGHPRYVGAGGMTDLAKDLAGGLDVRVATRVTAIASEAAGWSLATEADPAAPIVARAVLVTAPAPQTVALLDAGGVVLSPEVAGALAGLRYDPTLAVVVAMEGPSAVPAPGGVQLDAGPLSWVGDNHAKGVSPLPSVTLHASTPESAARLEDPPEVSLAALLDAGARWLGPSRVLDAQLVRWRYAQPTAPFPDPCLVAVEGDHPLVCAGDAFGQSRVEGAFLSGRAAADALLERLA